MTQSPHAALGAARFGPPLFTRAQAQGLDQDAIKRLGIPAAVLMENAGAGAARVILSAMGHRSGVPVVVAGPGNNGGDAWVVARHLLVAGFSPRCFSVATGRISPEARVQRSVLEVLGCSIVDLQPHSELGELFSGASYFVDGLFGTGLSREVTGLAARVIDEINRAPAPCASLDIPSGIDADTGEVLGAAVRAQLTTTFHVEKRGLHQGEGLVRAGRRVLVPIGIPTEAALESNTCRLDREGALALARSLERPANSHKGTFGSVAVVAGAQAGAAVLAARGASRMGAGKVTALCRPDALAAASVLSPETLCALLDESALFQAWVVGPGLGLDSEAADLALRLATQNPAAMVLDADALTHLASAGAECLRASAGPRVLTPHPKEAARLLGSTVQAVQKDRFHAVRQLRALTGAVVVLKGASTLVAWGDTCVAVGEPSQALAVAGSGDVLAGAIAALMGRGARAPHAALLGCWAHNLAGRGCRGVLASEIADRLSRARPLLCVD